MENNINYKNQIQLSNESWKKAWDQYPETMASLLVSMNHPVEDIGELKAEIKRVETDQCINDLECRIQHAEIFQDEKTLAKREYWKLAKEYKIRKTNEEPEKYKTKWA